MWYHISDIPCEQAGYPEEERPSQTNRENMRHLRPEHLEGVAGYPLEHFGASVISILVRHVFWAWLDK